MKSKFEDLAKLETINYTSWVVYHYPKDLFGFVCANRFSVQFTPNSLLRVIRAI